MNDKRTQFFKGIINKLKENKVEEMTAIELLKPLMDNLDEPEYKELADRIDNDPIREMELFVNNSHDILSNIINVDFWYKDSTNNKWTLDYFAIFLYCEKASTLQGNLKYIITVEVNKLNRIVFDTIEVKEKQFGNVDYKYLGLMELYQEE